MSNAWHSGRMILALSRHFDWFQNRMAIEYPVDGGIADLAFITRAGYLTEIEIKVSWGDWNADQHKRKFKRARPHISRFFYAVPQTMAGRIPEWVPANVGVLCVYEHNEYSDWVRVLRDARRTRCQKITPEQMNHLFERYYYRYWHQQLRRMSENFVAQKARAQTIASAA